MAGLAACLGVNLVHQRQTMLIVIRPITRMRIRGMAGQTGHLRNSAFVIATVASLALLFVIVFFGNLAMKIRSSTTHPICQVGILAVASQT